MEILEKVRNIIKNWQQEKKINTKEGFQCLYATVFLIDSIYEKDKNFYPRVCLEKYNFIKDIEAYYSNSDKEYHNEECTNLFLETSKNKELF